jgi:short subunit dehydrogenase-like uncharacterized protein
VGGALTGSQIIPQAGFESAPVDLGTYALVKAVRDELGVGVSEVTFSMHDLKCVSPNIKKGASC